MSKRLKPQRQPEGHTQLPWVPQPYEWLGRPNKKVEPDETLLAAIIYILVSGYAWRALPPCFGISKSTAHRMFLIWSRADVCGRLHEEILHRLDDAGMNGTWARGQ